MFEVLSKTTSKQFPSRVGWLISICMHVCLHSVVGLVGCMHCTLTLVVSSTGAVHCIGFRLSAFGMNNSNLIFKTDLSHCAKGNGFWGRIVRLEHLPLHPKGHVNLQWIVIRDSSK